MRRRGFVFGDIHFPFHHKLLLPLAVWICIKSRVQYIVQIGDLHDKYSSSKFPRSYNLFTPKEERTWCNYYAELFWMVLQQHLPEAEKYQLLGNHCVRPIKRVLEKAPEYEEELVSILHEDYTFDHVTTIYDPRDELIIDDIWYQHGHLSKLGAHCQYNHNNTVVGHTHRGGFDTFPLNGHAMKQIFELNSGYLADPNSPGLSYTMQKKVTRWTHGYGLVDAMGARFVPLHVGMIDGIKDDPLWKELANLW
jgi:hypothetical protein